VANELTDLVDGQTLYVEESEYEVTDVSVYNHPSPSSRRAANRTERQRAASMGDCFSFLKEPLLCERF